MKCSRCAVAVLMCLALGSALICAETYQAKVPFAFNVAKKVHPAGTYTVVFDQASPKALSLRPQSGPEVTVPIVTRLSPRETAKQEAQLVFDEVDGKYTLAELYIPGMDGFYLGSVLVEHKHVTVNAPK